MALFNLPKTKSTKSKDKVIASKSTQLKTPAPSIKGGAGLLNRIEQIKQMVEKNLGQYRDEYIYITESGNRADKEQHDRPVCRSEMPVRPPSGKKTQEDRNQHINPKLGDHTQQSDRLPLFLLLFGFSLF